MTAECSIETRICWGLWGQDRPACRPSAGSLRRCATLGDIVGKVLAPCQRSQVGGYSVGVGAVARANSLHDLGA